MVDAPSRLDRDALRQLRETAKQLHDPRPSMPMRELIAAATLAPAGGGITVDFTATRELGEPFIVVRMPAAAAEDDGQVAAGRLSPRERDVAALIAEGLSNKLIAHHLGLAVGTVKDHVHRILAKTGLANRAAIAGSWRGGGNPRPRR